MLGKIIKKAMRKDVVGKNRVTWIENSIVERFHKGHCPPSIRDRINNGEEVTIDETSILGIPLCYLYDKKVNIFVGKERVGNALLTSATIEELRKIKEDN